MPTIMTHAVLPLAIGLALSKPAVSSRLLVAGCIAAMAPDFDVIAFKLGIAYADAFGHRGATHSLLFAALLGLLALLAARRLQASRRMAFGFVALATLSHPLLDMLTNGGLGVALFWPVSPARLFAPWQVIEVSPIGLRGIFSERALTVFGSELCWVWLPVILLGLIVFLIRRATPGPNRG
jgi:inner membrane protein